MIEIRARLPSRHQAYSVFKAIAPAHFAVLLLTILVLIPAVSTRIGSSAFLVSTYLHLFFFPSGPIGDHIEKIVIHITVCAIGLAITSLFICITVWIDGNHGQAEYSTTGSKALGACVLTAWCFFGGLCESRFPKIKFAVRILLFSSVWTISTGASTINWGIFTNQFYPAAFAAGASLIASLVMFPHAAGSDFAKSLVSLYSVQRAVLDQTVSDFFNNEGTRKPSIRLLALRKELYDMNNSLKRSFQSACLEVSYGRVGVNEAKPLVASVKRTRGWISCGMGLGTREGQESPSQTSTPNDCTDGVLRSTVHEKKLLEGTRVCVSRLVEAISSSMGILSASIELTMNGGSPCKVKSDNRWNCLYKIESSEEVKKPGLTLARKRSEMSAAIDAFKEALAVVLKGLADSTSSQKGAEERDEGSSSTLDQCNASQADALFCTDTYDVAFLMISLLEVAKEVASNLVTCQGIMSHWQVHQRRRVFLPSVSLSSWTHSKFGRASQTGFVFHDDEVDAMRRDLQVASETEEGGVVREKNQDSSNATHQWVAHSKKIRWRIKLSKAFAVLKHSIHIKHALKLAGGTALLSLPAWLPGAQHWFRHERGQWLLVTYIWVLETSSAATIRIGLYRAIATISAAIYAIVAWYICDQGNRYAIAFFIVLAELPACYFILYTRHADNLGVNFAFTQSVILLYPFTLANASDPEKVAHLALVRAYQILLGIAAAFLVNMFIWPLHARVYLLRTISRITAQCSTEYLSLARQMLNSGVIVGPETSKKFGKLEDNIQIELSAGQEYLEIMQIEVSLIPKPIYTLSLVLKTLQRVADLLVLLRKCREVALRIIQKESCFNVLNLRRELVSNLLLSFWVVGQSLTTKVPMPQFLPSCRDALVDLTEAMREEINGNKVEVRTNSESNDTGESSSRDGIASSPAAANFVPIYRRKNRPGQIRQSGHSTPRQQKVIDYSYFFVFAEHTLLSEIIFEVEKLLYLTKMLVGESSFIDSHYLPRHDYFDPSMVDSEDVNAFQHSMTEHGINGRRLISQLDAHLRAAKSEAATARAVRAE